MKNRFISYSLIVDVAFILFSYLFLLLSSLIYPGIIALILVIIVNLINLISDYTYNKYLVVFSRYSLMFYFDVLRFFTQLRLLNKQKLRRAFIERNNDLVASLKKHSPDQVVIILPHCLQVTDCNIRITTDISNCKMCGKCSIGEIRRVTEEFSINPFVVTGGTLAKRLVADLKPELVIAVACERDLVEGVKEVFPFEVYCIINIRPEGPCINTTLNVDELRTAISKLIK